MSAHATAQRRAPARVAPAARERLVLIANPVASGHDPAELAAAQRVLGERYDIQLRLSEGRGHAVALAREALDDEAALIGGVGGDGTVSEIAGALAHTEATLVCLPAGVTNVFARCLGLPRRLVPAARRLAEGEQRLALVDLGTLDERPFTYMAGIGFTASMSASADAAPERKAALGQLHFAGVAAREIGARYLRRPPRMHLRASGREATGITVVAQNSHALTYFGPKAITTSAGAGLQTGTLSVALLERARPLDVAGVVGRLVTGRDMGAHPAVVRVEGTTSAVVESADGRPLPIDVDGEYLGERMRVELGVLPRALRVLCF